MKYDIKTEWGCTRLSWLMIWKCGWKGGQIT